VFDDLVSLCHCDVSGAGAYTYLVTGTLSAVNMQDFAGHKAGGFQEHHGNVLGDLELKGWLTIPNWGRGQRLNGR
jgi:hypothetical protein